MIQHFLYFSICWLHVVWHGSSGIVNVVDLFKTRSLTYYFLIIFSILNTFEVENLSISALPAIHVSSIWCDKVGEYIFSLYIYI